MTDTANPDAREWFLLDMDKPAVPQIKAVMASFEATHPGVEFERHTILGVDRGEPWLCIDGWIAPPDDQGPAPTDADIPMGFV